MYRWLSEGKQASVVPVALRDIPSEIEEAGQSRF